MLDMAVVIEELLMATVMGERGSLPRKSKMDWALMVFAVLLGCAGVFLSILGLERYFEEKYPLDIAALLSSAIVLAVAFLVVLITRGCQNRKEPPPHTDRQDFEKNLHTLLDGVCKELEGPVRESPKTAVLLAAIAGFIAAQRRI